jgi:hypothetical protein
VADGSYPTIEFNNVIPYDAIFNVHALRAQGCTYETIAKVYGVTIAGMRMFYLKWKWRVEKPTAV